MFQSKRIKSLVALSAAIMVTALLAPLASAATPAPGYTQFAGCPSPAENPNVELCVRNEIYGGHFQMGSKDVPITVPFTLSAGTDINFENLAFNAKGGLTPAKQKVPGGIIGLTGLTWLAEFLGSEALTLYAVTEIAAIPKSLAEEPQKLSIKVHLINSVLGNNCYVGSTTNPINLNLATGTTSPPPPNKPITGVTPEFSIDALNIIHFSKGQFVDNSFSAPGASGCVLTLFGFIPISINGLVNTQSGLPSPAGKNETRQNFNIEVTERSNVYP